MLMEIINFYAVVSVLTEIVFDKTFSNRCLFPFSFNIYFLQVRRMMSKHVPSDRQLQGDNIGRTNKPFKYIRGAFYIYL